MMPAHTLISTRSAIALATATLVLLSGCANLAPGYSQPQAPVPASWQEQGTAVVPAALPASAASAATAGSAPTVQLNAETSWRDVIRDERLRGTIDLALDNSRSLRLAVLAIEQARATYQIQDAATLPTVNASASGTHSRTPAQASTSGQTTISHSYSAGLGISSYEVDLFGRIRNLKDSALEVYLQTEAAQRSTRLALIAEVANAWLSLQADQAQLQLAQETLASQEATYQLGQQRARLGADSALTLAQTQTSVESARRDVAAYEAQVQQDQHALNLLAGTTVPTTLLPGAELDNQSAAILNLPSDLPSSLLQRRPDVVAAEHALKASYADIGAARANLFPSISLTASAGTASRSLGDLFKGGAWSFAPSVSLPIFDGGANRATVRKAEVARDIQVATYEQTIQTAFSEVADALSVRATLARRLGAQQALVDAWQRSYALSQARYQMGADDYLSVLDAQRSLYSARQTLISLAQTDLANRITLFKVMGGGWSEPATASVRPASAPAS
jgi:NodT family efflux transporter outer membrane factor (OMF) lipoprotein